MYVVEYKGDIHGQWSHLTLEAALRRVEDDFPARWVDNGTFEYRDQQTKELHILKDASYEGTPDPEDDRIVIYRCDPPHMIPVWHFSGWHWDSEEFGLPQGKLPGHDKSLYEEACL